MGAAEDLARAITENDRSRTHLRLYDIADELIAIETVLYDNGGELTPELEARLEAFEGALENKIDRICSVISNNAAAAKAAKEESERLAKLAKSREGVASSLKRYLQSVLTQLDKQKVETGRFRVRIQKNGRPSIKWGADEATIPDTFKRTVVSLDGDAAYAAYSAGSLPEGFVVEVGSHLRVE